MTPSIWLGVSARAGQDESPPDVRRKVLASMAADPASLINVSRVEMPSSPDILNLGKRGTKALERCLQDNANADVRVDCARMLHALGDRSALPNLRAALDDWDANVRKEVILALESMPEDASFDGLYKLYGRGDESDDNRLAIIDALGALSSQRAVRVLRNELHKAAQGESDPRARIFTALWRSRHLLARETLIGDVGYVLASDLDELVLRGTDAAAELRSGQLVPKLVPLMEHHDEHVRNRAVYALGKIGDPIATRALLAHVPKVREARMLNNIAFALERLDPKAFFPAVQTLVTHKQAVIRLNAAFVLGDVKRPEGLPMLERALGDASDFVKTSAIVAMGKLNEPKAIPSIEKYVSDPNPAIKSEAVYTIVKLSEGKRKDLIYDVLFSSPDAQKPAWQPMRRRAAVTLGELGDSRVRDYLLGCFESGQCKLASIRDFVLGDRDARTAGRMLLNWTRGHRELVDLIGQLKPPGSVPLAESSFDEALAHQRLGEADESANLMGDLGDPSARGRLGAVSRDRDTWLRLYAGVARLRLGDGSVVPALLADFDNLPVEWLADAAELFSRVAEPAAQKALIAELERRSTASDPEIAMACAAVLLAWDPENRFFRLLDGLSASSTEERELSEYYLSHNHSEKLTWVIRRALAREQRPYTRDRLRTLLDSRG